MSKRLMAIFICSILGLIGASGSAFAGMIGRYECSIIGLPMQDPVGDRTGHMLVTVQYSCFGVEGLLKGTVHAVSSVSEWDGPQGAFLIGGGTQRAPGGLAVTQIAEGTAWVVKPSGTESKGVGSSSLLRVRWPRFQGNLSNLPPSRRGIFGSISNTRTDIELKSRVTGDGSLTPPAIRQWPFISGPFGCQNRRVLEAAP
jgi:hypothetical protein